MRRRAHLALTCLLNGARAAAAQGVDLSLEATAAFYGDNTEFSNPFREGETTIGAYAQLFVEARASDRLAIRAGVFGNQRFGSGDAFEQVRPVLALVVGGARSRLVLGTLETVRRVDGPGPDRTGPHSLLPPVQRETLAFDRPWEAGLQWIVESPRFTQEAWVNWQQSNTAERREVFDTGVKSRWRIRRAVDVRGDVFLVHQGGQLSGNGPVSDSLSGTIGIDVGGPAGALDRLGFEAFALASRHVPNREDTSLARSGFATFLRVSAEEGHWRLHGILWRGDDFVAREGDPHYQSIRRDGTAYRSLRDYAEAGLTRLFPLAPRSWLEASVRWHRVENDYEYSFRIFAVAALTLGK
jgi:hypothetical protein